MENPFLFIWFGTLFLIAALALDIGHCPRKRALHKRRRQRVEHFTPGRISGNRWCRVHGAWFGVTVPGRLVGAHLAAGHTINCIVYKDNSNVFRHGWRSEPFRLATNSG